MNTVKRLGVYAVAGIVSPIVVVGMLAKIIWEFLECGWQLADALFF